MDWTGDTTAVIRWVKKYRAVFLVILAGIVFMLFPAEGSSGSTTPIRMPEEASLSLQQQLEEILSQLEGAGRVRVLLTEAQGSQTHYETRQDRREEETSRQLQTETVILTGSDRSEEGLVSRVDPPVYLGAVVLCQGADSASVRLAVVDAVSAATGLGADKISVWKMK